MIYQLPEWSSIFDIDNPEDMEESIELYPWAKKKLKNWRGPISVVHSINSRYHT
jgi:hypothetical protein